ncbi:hypothetical protein N177_3723 [Lutibaculum baratangense AMV1]|uniref:Uncharacterized protein n=1 Tax=Lutibaculum baratangense AMV1 TaxID=631454 RepID=V4QS48_9HYPH|nr:hypothetical protein N177_3723 [Lutibaculum baratangense AMV1]
MVETGCAASQTAPPALAPDLLKHTMHEARPGSIVPLALRQDGSTGSSRQRFRLTRPSPTP